ncbi:MAG: lamin tail domain-containing protein [bacterium]|nr:lamin tail domain-containing protein [bacterium]MDZ4299851.1 lamin tail domain-containing protein [Candidatus Sungbacteria bacterium]
MRAYANITASFSLLLFLISPAWVGASGTVINEVLFDPLGADTGLERIELYNGSATADDLSGWELYPDGIGYIVFPAHFVLKPYSVLTVHLREAGNDTESDLYVASSTIKTNMGNTSGSAALFSAEPRGKETIKSFVEWGKGGETWESAASDAGLWSRGTFVGSANMAEGNSIALKEDGVTEDGSGAWEVIGRPTIGQPNKSGGTLMVSSVTATSSSSGMASLDSAGAAGQEVRAVPPIPTIKSYAGQDRNTVAGSIVSFLGYGIGLTDKPIESARFLWNFGDGETAEGRAVEHIFRFPGTYLIGLHVASGEYAASDYATVVVAPNQLRIVEVVPGSGGFIRLENPSAVAIDVGGWRLEDGAMSFILPSGTRIAPHAAAALPNETTRLAGVVSDILPKIVLRYANGIPAETFSGGIRGITPPAEHVSATSALPPVSRVAMTSSSVPVPLPESHALPVGKEIPRITAQGHASEGGGYKITTGGVASTVPASAVLHDENGGYSAAHAASLIVDALPESTRIIKDAVPPWMFFAAAGVIALGAALGFLFLKMKV